MCMWIAWLSDMWVSDMSNSRCYVRRRRVVTGTVFIAAHVWLMEHLSGPGRGVYSSGYGGEVGAVETRWDLEELWELERQFVRVMRDAENGRGAGKV